MADCYLSIIIPVYNEEKRIVPTLEKIIDFCASQPKHRFELILSMDGCADRSAEVAKAAGERLLPKMSNCSFHMLESLVNHGKGYSVRKGMLFAQGRYILFSDADLSTPIEEANKLISCLDEGFDAAIGSRNTEGSKVEVKQNIVRQSMGRMFNVFVRIMTGLPYKDTQCGFKCFPRHIVKRIFPLLKVDDFSFDVEILYLAKKFNLKVKEVPVCWINSPESKVRMVRDSWNMLKTLSRISRLHAHS